MLTSVLGSGVQVPAGTALLFVGSVTHAGQPVSAGERCVFVSSFSPATGRDLSRAAASGDGIAQQGPADEEEVWRAEEEVDSCPVATGAAIILL